MSTCAQQTLANPNVQLAIKYWYIIVIALMLAWIIKRGVR